MREMSLRWGLGLGAVAAVIGLGSQLLSGLLAPRGASTTFDQTFRYLLIAAPLALLTLGIALGLAYFAGLRAEHDRPPKEGAARPDPLSDDRRDSALAGAIVMALYCLFTTFLAVLLDLRTPTISVSTLLGQRAIQAVLFVILGYGMGALGGRVPAVRSLLDEISSPASEAHAATDSEVAPVAPGAQDASPRHDDISS